MPPEPAAEPETISPLLEHYHPSSHFDELFSASGELHPHWHYLLRVLEDLGPEEIEERSREIGRLLRDNGVTGGAFGEPRQLRRPWVLDPVPLLISSHDWLDIERGVQQRAELLNLLLKDLYGPAKVLRKGLLPPELIYASPTFLRPCHGLSLPDDRMLQFYSADLERCHDGSFQITTDRCGSLGGIGYALENRVVLSRVFPSLFRDSQVHRLAAFFRRLRYRIHKLANEQSEPLRIVILSPGPGDEAYFEHAYIARYLGYTLVEGADLTVREGRVWLKTLEGLQPVQVIIRWLESHLCDPLELREDSLFGIAGLVQAVRSQNVTVLNPLGAEAVNSPALTPFLPELCQYLLGEPLQLPSSPRWWCGRKADYDYVTTHLDELAIRTLLPEATTLLNGSELSANQRHELLEQMRHQPQLYIAQPVTEPTTAPLFEGRSLRAHPVLLQIFAAADEGGYQLLPGGIGRLAGTAPQRTPLLRHGGISKDIWLLASEPELQFQSMMPGNDSVPQFRRNEIPSRVIENLFWLGRYLERAESSVRLLRTVLLMLLNPVELPLNNQCQHGLLRAITRTTETYPGFIGDGAAARLKQPEAELMSVFLDRERPGTLSFNLNALLYAARSVRERISSDIWRVFNRIEESLELLQNQNRFRSLTNLDSSGEDALNDAQEQLDELVIAFAAFNGLMAENMTYGQGWRFLSIGRRLERATQMTHLLQATLSTPCREESAIMEQLLVICDSQLTYRSRYRTQVHIHPLLDLLLQDETNPRSLSFQLDALQHFITELPRHNLFAYKSREERLVLEAISRVRLADPALLGQTEGESPPQRQRLIALLADLESLLPHISDAMSNAYFNHTENSTQLVQLEGVVQ
ncbi:hypothetical protein D5085_12275 [Ectothiorhodospiraceae bacterium BW-2]|nr:hypothetical protein D5085_12275 [Ectothiorhodospiraceae bacterium BW-2]